MVYEVLYIKKSYDSMFKYPINLEISDNPLSPDTGLFRVLSSRTAYLPMIIDEMVKEMPDVPR